MRLRKTKWAMLGSLAASIVLGGLSQARAQSDPVTTFDSESFQVSYFDVDTAFVASRAGYGGPNMSGGAGDNTVRTINPTAGESLPGFNGTLCAMIYVFDDFEEMQACCGCPVTSDGLRTISVINDLTFDFGVNKGNLNAGVIDIVSSKPNFFNSTPPPGPNPPGTNLFCSPTGKSSNDPFKRSSPVAPVRALRSWITHNELQEPGNITAATAHNPSVEEFLDSKLESTHLDNLQKECSFLISNGSGTGTCTCGVGDEFPATGSTAAR